MERRRNSNSVLDIVGCLVYILNPILSIPVIIYGMIRGTKLSVFLYSFVVSFISFMYVPNIEMDKARHIEFYDLSLSLNLEQFFVMNFEGSPDFLFRLILFIGANVGISFQVLTFAITFLTVYLIMKSYFAVYKRYIVSNRYRFLVVTLFVFSISYIDVISGIRYTLAISFLFYGFCSNFLNKNRFAIIWIVLGVLIHFSVVIFAIIYLFSKYLNKIKIKYFRWLLLVSLFFIILPKENVFNLFQSFGFGGTLNEKVDAYLNIQFETHSSSFGQRFIDFFNILWVYIITIYLLLRNSTNDYYAKLLILSIALTNIFIAFPVIYNRYALYVKLLLVLYFIVENIKKNDLKIPVIIAVIFCIISLNQVIVMRDGIIPLFVLDLEEGSFINQVIENSFSLNKIK